MVFCEQAAISNPQGMLVILATVALAAYGRWIAHRENAPGEFVELWS